MGIFNGLKFILKLIWWEGKGGEGLYEDVKVLFVTRISDTSDPTGLKN